MVATDASKLAFTIEHLPKVFTRGARIIHYYDALRSLNRLAQRYPHVTRGPSPILSGYATLEWATEMVLGKGPRHMVIDVLSHGDEPFMLATVVGLAKFWCQHDWLLEGRTIRLLFTSTQESMRNTSMWAVLDSLPSLTGPNGRERRDLPLAVITHWRNVDDWLSDCWSWPLPGTPPGRRPTQGAFAGMWVMECIRADEGELVLWETGHNAFVSSGVQNHVEGPNDDASALRLEDLSGRPDIQIPLDRSSPDSPTQKRHPGALASFKFVRGTDLQAGANGDHGGSAYDWGIQNGFPEMTIHACEVGMYRPRDKRMYPWRHMTRRVANLCALDSARYIPRIIEKVIEISQDLDPCDPTVAATQALGPVVEAWKARTVGLEQDMLHPHEAFKVSCTEPLYFARAAAAGLWMLRAHFEHFRQLNRVPQALHGDLSSAIGEAVSWWTGQVVRKPVAPALRLQALSGEVAYFGALGVHPETGL
jgi:hypothetical protein